MRYAFHEAAIADERVGVVVDDVVARAVEFLRQQRLRQRHADGVGDALPQRPGGGFDARGDADLRMARRAGMQLAEPLELVDRQVVAGKVQQRIDEHRAVPVRQHEAVAGGPGCIRRVVAQMARPQCHGDLGHAHRRAGMAGIGLLDRIHGQCANGVRHGHDLGRRVAHWEFAGGAPASIGTASWIRVYKALDFNIGAP